MNSVNKVLETLHLSKSKVEPPKVPSEQEFNDLREKYTKAKQEHVFTFYDKLPASGKAALYAQLADIDPEHVNTITERALKPMTNESSGPAKLEPLPESASASILDSEESDLASWNEHGLKLIAGNKVGVVLMAGGQGTRLGSSAPKGCYNIGLPSEKSLFELQAQRIIKVQQLAAIHSTDKDKSVVVPWYVMTSGPTREPTEKFFAEHNYFGMEKENILFFEQGVLPCIDNDGKILLEAKDKVAVAPDGNGGLYKAMLLGGVVEDMSKRGIEHVHAYCVDNCLVKVADPVFIGYAASKEVSIATKVVRKRNAKESVGLILEKNGKPDVVEYSEIDSETAEAKDPKHPDLLKFRAANIVNHYYSFAFLNSMSEWTHRLPHHVAKKKIPFVNLETGESNKPEKPNGIKLEQFVFDCFPFLELSKFACLEVRREDEFSPLKNAKGTGEDDEDTSRKHIMEQGRKWLETAGAIVVSEGSSNGVEVSPLISYVSKCGATYYNRILGVCKY